MTENKVRITALVENQSHGELTAKHGLSLLIETTNHRILFDLGPDETLFHNCKKRGIDLTTVDTVVISHGHRDHGGALSQFLEINNTAKVYVQRRAFERHYTKVALLKLNIGLDESLKTHSQIVLLDGDYCVDDELMLFTVPNTQACYSPANKTLYTLAGKDDFLHEQNLMITSETPVLVMGCGHAGIVNILERSAQFEAKVCIGGYHLFNPLTKKVVPNKLLEEIALKMAEYDISYYTCHCTGQVAFEYLSNRLPRMSYLSCGEEIQF